ncbi:capsid protein [Escherichia coli]|nr:capsid protein [Escherichia coli]
MTAELRNLPHIASMAFNEPLMLEPAYARVFFCALAGQLGISRLTDAVSGDSLTAGEAPAALALSGDDDGPRQARSYQVMNGIAVLPVSGMSEFVVNDAPEQADDAGPAEPVSAGKCSTVS